ncbi:MAG: SpoIID/LytB domain-containing protein, partial [Candidatus Limnocylindrales bacterium]
MVTEPAEDSMLPRPSSPPLSAAVPAPSWRARRRVPAILIAAVAAIALSALGPPLRIATTAAGGLSNLTFHGRGYGHGVGMSQYGARGRALVGQLAPEILAHYFPKTALATRSTTVNVRVLLLTGFKATALEPLTIAGLGGPLTVDGIGIAFPANAIVTLAPTAPGATTWTLRVASPTGKVLARRMVTGDVTVRPTDEAGVLKVASKATTTNVYRGFVRIRLTATAVVVNHVTIERYLRGVVPLEMPATWPTEALRAQAIAARSYGLYHVHPTKGLFDVYDDTRSQVYRGVGAERATSDLAIGATAGTILVSGSSVVNAMFHSADGGWTENNE